MEQQQPACEGFETQDENQYYSTRDIARIKRLPYWIANEVMHKSLHITCGKNAMRARLSVVNATLRGMEKKG